MTVDEFRADLEAEIRNDALSFGNGTQATFAEKITTMMREAEYLNGDYQEAFFVGKHKSRNLRVDGYMQDVADNSFVLFIVYYSDDDETMIKTLAEKQFKMLETFVDAVLTNNLDIEESTGTADLATLLKDSRDEKIKFILLTNARRSAVLRDLKKFFFRGQEVECQIWDIERIFAAYNSMQVREPVEIDFRIYGGIPCLRADAASDDSFESFLCVIPGKVLADIYDQYGSRILEGNVRSFLSTKCAVNKKIRATILNKPENFLPLTTVLLRLLRKLSLNLPEVACALCQLSTSKS
jgi:hypothetical protein